MTERLDNLIDSYITDFIFNSWSPEPLVEITDDKIYHVYVIPTDRFNFMFNMFNISYDECKSHFNKWFIKNNPQYENVRAITFMDSIREKFNANNLIEIDNKLYYDRTT